MITVKPYKVKCYTQLTTSHQHGQDYRAADFTKAQTSICNINNCSIKNISRT